MVNTSLPRLTCLFLAYNRQECVKEALESAFAMEYEGELEFVICDDCSTDATFSIIRECVANYKGEHRVVALQTPHNMNLASNACYAVRHATGDWIVRADDDDLNFPDRCRRIADAIARFPQALCLLEPLQLATDEECRPESVRAARPDTMWRGHCYDWHTLRESGHYAPLRTLAVKTYARSLYSLMGELPQEAFSVDDVTLGLRALSQGCIVALYGAPSILYRQTASNMSSTLDGDFSPKAIREKEEKVVRIHQRAAKGLRCVEKQFQTQLKATPPGAEREPLEFLTTRVIPRLIAERELNVSWWQLGTLKRLHHWRRTPKSLSKYSFGLVRTLPMPLAICGYALLKKLAAFARQLKG